MNMIGKWISAWRRGQEVQCRGWQSLGMLWWALKRECGDAEARRLTRYSNRLYRLNGHGNPWKPYRGF